MCICTIKKLVEQSQKQVVGKKNKKSIRKQGMLLTDTLFCSSVYVFNFITTIYDKNILL